MSYSFRDLHYKLFLTTLLLFRLVRFQPASLLFFHSFKARDLRRSERAKHLFVLAFSFVLERKLLNTLIISKKKNMRRVFYEETLTKLGRKCFFLPSKFFQLGEK